MLIDKIKALFNSETIVVENKFKDAKLVDGTIVRVEGDEFKVGDDLKVITEDGQVENAPEGMHETTDGEIFVVNGEGKITEIRKPEVNVESETEDAPTVESTTENMEEIEVEVEKPGLEERVLALEEALAMLISKLEAKKEEMEVVATEIEILKAENEGLKIKNEELSKVPAVEPTKIKRFEKVIVDKKDSKINVELLSKVSALREKIK